MESSGIRKGSRQQTKLKNHRVPTKVARVSSSAYQSARGSPEPSFSVKRPRPTKVHPKALIKQLEKHAPLPLKPAHKRNKSYHFNEVPLFYLERKGNSKPTSKKPSVDLSQEATVHHKRTQSGNVYCLPAESRKAKQEFEKDQIIEEIQSSFATSGAPPPTALKHYTLGKPLGNGAFGKVYLAVHKLTGLKVAIKSVDKLQIKEEKARRKVSQEVFIMNRVRHPNIIRLLEVFETQSNLFIVVEYAGGSDLLQLLKAREKLPESEARLVFRQVLEAVQACHVNNIIHRDIKLDNLLLTSDYTQVKLCDFGISRMVVPGELINDQCGTPAYLAPEIILNQGYEPFYVDIWSLGVLLYALVCGMMPLRASNLTELHQLILNCDYDLPPWLSEECKQLISRLIYPVPHMRLGLKEILEHPWFCMTEDTAELAAIPRFFGKRPEKDNGRKKQREILRQLQEMGFPEEYVIQSLRFKDNNFATATYQLLDLHYANTLSFL